ncbi:MAG: DEAD/DEAH box helicase [Hyphomicrobiales bacterium]
MTFSELGLSAKTLKAVETAGYTTPTPIQANAIPVALKGQDVLGIAQTGTGKTASFVLPMLTRLERGRARARMPRSLILEPTRELAAQVAEAFESLGAEHRLTVALLIGGVSFDEQDRKLDRGADIVIATPGRLLDHFQRGKLLLTGIEILVVDEADRMLDMGFIPDIERICSLLPPRRQTLFFSATMPKEIQRLVDRFLKSPERIEVAPPSTTNASIKQRLKFSPNDPKEKRAALRELLRMENVRNGIVFCNRKRDVAIIHKSLVRHGFNAAALHGDLGQHERMATLDGFRKGDITFLAASDVAARGLDIPDVSHIFNYDVPHHPEDYVHRIGRTGRAGKEGFAAMLVTPADMQALKAIKDLVRSDIEWIGGPPDQSEARSGEERQGRSPRGGRRRRGKRSGGGGSQPRDAAPRQDHDAPPRDKRQAAPAGDNGQKQATAAPRPQEGESRNRRDSSRRRDNSRRDRQDRHQSDQGKPVRGLGDHVPAFLMRPSRTSAE